MTCDRACRGIAGGRDKFLVTRVDTVTSLVMHRLIPWSRCVSKQRKCDRFVSGQKIVGVERTSPARVPRVHHLQRRNGAFQRYRTDTVL